MPSPRRSAAAPAPGGSGAGSCASREHGRLAGRRPERSGSAALDRWGGLRPAAERRSAGWGPALRLGRAASAARRARRLDAARARQPRGSAAAGSSGDRLGAGDAERRPARLGLGTARPTRRDRHRLGLDRRRGDPNRFRLGLLEPAGRARARGAASIWLRRARSRSRSATGCGRGGGSGRLARRSGAGAPRPALRPVRRSPPKRTTQAVVIAADPGAASRRADRTPRESPDRAPSGTAPCGPARPRPDPIGGSNRTRLLPRRRDRARSAEDPRVGSSDRRTRRRHGCRTTYRRRRSTTSTPSRREAWMPAGARGDEGVLGRRPRHRRERHAIHRGSDGPAPNSSHATGHPPPQAARRAAPGSRLRFPLYAPCLGLPSPPTATAQG